MKWLDYLHNEPEMHCTQNTHTFSLSLHLYAVRHRFKDNKDQYMTGTICAQNGHVKNNNYKSWRIPLALHMIFILKNRHSIKVKCSAQLPPLSHSHKHIHTRTHTLNNFKTLRLVSNWYHYHICSMYSLLLVDRTHVIKSLTKTVMQESKNDEVFTAW